MGYYTLYTLELLNATEEEEKRIAYEIGARIGYYGIGKEVADCLLEDLSGDMHKWYENEEDMLEISALYPDIGFTLYGEGENSDDKWVKYFREGKSYYAEAVITYPPPPKEFNFDILEITS